MRPQCLPTIMNLTKAIVSEALQNTDARFAVDGTAGNGHDTLFLARMLAEKGATSPAAHVYGFDVQLQAVEETRRRIEEAGLSHLVTVVHDGHQTVGEHVPADVSGKLAVAMFNLGYLPGSDKSIITRAESTIASLTWLTEHLAVGGVITVHVYTGHDGGTEEGNMVEAWCSELDWHSYRVAKYDFANKKQNLERLLAIEKIR